MKIYRVDTVVFATCYIPKTVNNLSISSIGTRRVFKNMLDVDTPFTKIVYELFSHAMIGNYILIDLSLIKSERLLKREAAQIQIKIEQHVRMFFKPYIF